MKAVTAPSVLKRDRFAAKPVASLGGARSARAGGGASFVCPLFE
jgi:hypothetical protein